LRNETKKERTLGSTDESIVLSVIANPEPQDSAIDVNAQGAMMKADSARPKPAHTL